MFQKSTVILDQVILVRVDASIYGARKKLRIEDLQLASGSVIPPNDLASLGSKKLVDPDRLAVFNRLKKEVERVCLQFGTRFMGGYAIPKTVADSVVAQLEAIQSQFLAAKQEFVTHYNSWVDEWVTRHPDFEQIINKAIDDVAYVESRFGFEFYVVSVSPPKDLAPATQERLDTQIDSLSDSLFKEVAQEAKLLIDRSLLGKDELTRNALRPFVRIRDKLDGLGFLDRRVQPVVETIDRLLARCPKKGPINGSFLSEVMSHAFLLSDPEKTKLHGAGLMAIGNAMPDVVLPGPDACETTDREEEVLPAPESAATAQDVSAAGHVEVEPVETGPAPASGDGEFSTEDAVAKIVKNMGNIDLFGMFADIDDEAIDDRLTVNPSATMASSAVQANETQTQTAQPEPLAVLSPSALFVQQVEEPEDLWL